MTKNLVIHSFMLRIMMISICCTFLYSLVGQDQNSSIDSLMVVASEAYQAGDFKYSKSIYVQLDSLQPRNREVMVKLASIYEQEENTPKALKYYLQLTEVDSLKGKYFRKCAHQYLKAGEKAQSLHYYEHAHYLNPNDFLTSKALGELFIQLGETLRADTILKEALAYDSLNIHLNQLYARNAYRQKDYGLVIQTLESINGRVDFNSYYAKLFGFAYLQVDSLEQAVFWLTRALADKADSENVHYYLSEAYKKLDDLTAAKYHLELAIQNAISPKTGRYYRNLAKIFDEEKNLKAALPAYEAAYRYDEDPRMLFFLARGYDAYYADKSVAVKYYKRYIKSKDNVPEYMDYARERMLYLKEQIHQLNAN